MCALALPVALAGNGDLKASDRIPLAHVWAGTPVEFAAIYRGGFFFIAFYTVDRDIGLIKTDAEGRVLERETHAERFGGWDAHNALEMDVDAAGYLHLFANMHASPLTYFRSVAPHSVRSMARIDRMIGRDESRVTYPRLFMHAGRLFVTYRAGGSGDGRWVLNHYDATRWVRADPGVLFADRDGDGRVSAYPTRFVPDANGALGVVYVWRRSTDASSNFRMCFAKTRDFVTWQAINGFKLRSPLGSECPMPIEDTGPGNGLTNNPALFFSPSGIPVVLYHKYDEDGCTQVFVAFWNGKNWDKRNLTDWRWGFRFSGRGSIPLPFVYTGQKASNGSLLITVRHEHFPTRRLGLDLESMAWFTLPASMQEPVLPSTRREQTVRILDERSDERGLLSWSALKPHRDTAPSDLEAALPTSELALYVSNRMSDAGPAGATQKR
jgi:hypothetical protein